MVWYHRIQSGKGNVDNWLVWWGLNNTQTIRLEPELDACLVTVSVTIPHPGSRSGLSEGRRERSWADRGKKLMGLVL